ncbi:MAG: hemerythrin domain-containing protein [Candidatus Thermoplasmatota archaeon]
MKVLIGEGNRATRTLLENTIETMDFDVKKEEGTDGVMDALKDEDFDILFLSWRLLDKDSFEFLRDIREIEKSKNLYIILTMPEDKEDIDLTKYLKEGMNDFIVKPLNRDLIRSRIRKARVELGVKEGKLTVEPLEDLKEDHDLLRRMANIFELAHYRIMDEVPQKVADWVGSVAETLNQEVHHTKEKEYLISFIENSMEEQGESPDSKLFSRASLKQVEEEHRKLEEMTEEIRQIVKDYKDEKVEAGRIRDILREYKELIRDHIDREERFLFPLSKKYMDEETSKELMHRFNEIEEKVGQQKIEKFERQISNVEEKFYLK